MRSSSKFVSIIASSQFLLSSCSAVIAQQTTSPPPVPSAQASEKPPLAWEVAEEAGEAALKKEDYATAVEKFREALSQCEAVDPESLDVATLCRLLAQAGKPLGHIAEMEPLYKRTLAIRTKKLGLDHEDTLTVMQNLAICYGNQRRFSEATAQFRQALPLYERKMGKESDAVATVLSNIAWSLRGEQKYSEAQSVSKRAVEILEKNHGANNLDVALEQRNLANLYNDLGQYAESAALYKRVLQVQESLLGLEDLAVASTLVKLGGVYLNSGRSSEALDVTKRALRIDELKLAADDLEIANVLDNLANIYLDQGLYSEAEALYKRALTINESKLGPNHIDVANVLANLAMVYQYQAHYDEAEALLKRSLSIQEKTLGADHPNVVHVLNNFAILYSNQERYAEAEDYAIRATKTLESKFGPDHPNVARALNSVARMVRNQGRFADAEILYKRALKIDDTKLGVDSIDSARTCQNLADCFVHEGRYADAEPFYLRALAIRQKAPNSSGTELAGLQNSLANLYIYQGRYAESESYELKSLKVREEQFGTNHPSVAVALNNLATCYLAEGKYEQCEIAYLQCRAIRKNIGVVSFRDRALALKALELGRKCGFLQDPASELKPGRIIELLANLKDAEKSFGTESAQVGEAELSLALHIANIGGPSIEFAKKSFAVLKTKQDHSLQTARRSSELLLCLAYLFDDAGADDQAKLAVRASLECLTNLSPDAATIDDANQLLNIAAYLKNLALYADAIGALETVDKICDRLNDDNLRLRRLMLLSQVNIALGDFILGLQNLNSASKYFKSNDPVICAQALDATAGCLSALGRFELATTCAEEALTLKIAAKTPRQELLPTLLVLAELHLARQDLPSANRYVKQASAITSTLDKNSDRSQLAAFYEVQGDIEYEQDNLDEALLAYKKSSEINKYTAGRILQYVQNLNAIGKIQARWHNGRLARYNVLSAADFMIDYADTAFNQLSFAEQCAFVDRLIDQTDLLLTVCAEGKTASVAYDCMMKWKGLLIESLRRRTAISMAESAGPELQKLIELLNAAKKKLKVLCDQGADVRSGVKPQIEQTSAECEALERLIMRKSGGVEIADPMSHLSFSDLKKLLLSNEALVDIIGYRDCFSDKYLFAAVVVTRDAEPVVVKIDDAEFVKKAILDWRATAIGALSVKRDLVLDKNSAPEDYKKSVGREEGARLQLVKLLWKPINEKLPASIQKVWLCPDSDVALIPWNILAKNSKVQISVIDSPREFVSLKRATKKSLQNGKLLIAGGLTFGGMTPKLPGTAVELAAIKSVGEQAKVLVEPFTGKSATEPGISRSLSKCSYAHFATHGFYFGGSREGAANVRSTRALALVRQANGELSLIDARNPLMSSGLLLSGGQVSGDTTGNGKLTAGDIVGLDLSKCNLVTLSACETGLGKRMGGQGVLGLRSAILGAGAHAVLMSLWKVDDDATCKLMTEFYTNLLEKHVSPVDSLERAQEVVRKIPKWKAAFYWAGWVLAGDGWR